MAPNQIRELRDELGWTQNQMGTYLNISQVGIWRWESGQSAPDDYRGAMLWQLRERLDEAKADQQKQEFIEGLKIAGAISAVALLAYLFSKD